MTKIFNGRKSLRKRLLRSEKYSLRSVVGLISHCEIFHCKTSDNGLTTTFSSHPRRKGTRKPRNIAGMGPATQKYNGAKITGLVIKLKFSGCEENNFGLDCL